MKLVIWISVLTDHQIHLFNVLQKYLTQSIEYVVGTQMLPEREAQGWSNVDCSSLNIHLLHKCAWLKEAHHIVNNNLDAIHIFGGFFADRRFLPILLIAQLKGVQTALMMEPFVEEAQSYFNIKPNLIDKLKVYYRPFIYKLTGKLISKRLIAAFAISKKSKKQFLMMGVENKRIFLFGYFVPKLIFSRNLTIQCKKNSKLKIIFVGNLIARKGLNTLLESVSILQNDYLNILLDVYGPGEISPSVVKRKGITYQGKIPFGRTQKFISAYDLMVVPSLHDGWGVVVNEALLQGVPVIVSDATGSKTLVEKSNAGMVFKAGDVMSLTESLRTIYMNPNLLDELKFNARKFSPQLDPNIAASYFFKCLCSIIDKRDEHPVCPWYV